MPGPLHGYRVVDLTTMIAGPMAAMLLADQGADVVKVEGPDRPDHVRRAGFGRDGLTASFLNNNRNKRSLAVDLKQAAGRAVLREVVRGADVLLQNFRPGVMDRLGLGYAALQAVNPGLVYVSMSGFGETGPYAHKPVYDPIIQALSGLTTVQAGSDTERPRLVRTIVPDKVTALTAAQAVTSALLARDKPAAKGGTGEGQHVRLSMLDSVIAFLWSSDMGGLTFVGHEVAVQKAATFIDLIYETAAGYISVSVMTDEQWRALAACVGHPEWLEDPRFGTPALRDANADARLELIQQALLSRPAAEWLGLLDDAGVPCAPVLTRREVLAHPQVQANGVLVELDHPGAGRVRQARAAARFEATPNEMRLGAPRLGEHTREVLREAGYADEAIEALLREGVVTAA
jgi:crotonobetainyl-CoA:carnitine CoA-transferase CaiB-like acyl-CoA transferase